MTRIINETGNRYGKLIVIERATSVYNDKPRWVCKCDCGNRAIVRCDHLRRGKIKSCGCALSYGKTKPKESPCAAKEMHPISKFYCVQAPADLGHKRYTFRNLTNFVRENPQLFNASDVAWRCRNDRVANTVGNQYCRAHSGLKNLFNKVRHVGSWKGWRAVWIADRPGAYAWINPDILPKV